MSSPTLHCRRSPLLLELDHQHQAAGHLKVARRARLRSLSRLLRLFTGRRKAARGAAHQNLGSSSSVVMIS